VILFFNEKLISMKLYLIYYGQLIIVVIEYGEEKFCMNCVNLEILESSVYTSELKGLGNPSITLLMAVTLILQAMLENIFLLFEGRVALILVNGGQHVNFYQ
jgi:hypothetical protein